MKGNENANKKIVERKLCYLQDTRKMIIFPMKNIHIEIYK